MNIWSGLLFLEGAIADPALARELAADEARVVSPATATETNDDAGFTREVRGRDRPPLGAGLY